MSDFELIFNLFSFSLLFFAKVYIMLTFYENNLVIFQ
jgi:hypothetical protein